MIVGERFDIAMKAVYGYERYGADLAREFNLTTQATNQYKKKEKANDNMREIAQKKGISLSWLEFGEGEMLESDQKSELSDIRYEDHKMISAPIMSVKASAGIGNEHYDVVTTGELLIDRMLFKVLPNLKNIRAIEVEGDSMYPTLKEGDYVIIEENCHFSGDGIYVLHYDGVLLVKRLQADIDGIEILSDNQSYGKRKYDPNDDQRLFHIAGKVILRMQR